MTTGAFSIGLDEVGFIGTGLVRPECVVVGPDGVLHVADWRGGVTTLAPDGTQTLITGRLPDGRPARPNGIALCADGSYLLADLGEELGGLFRLFPDGTILSVLESLDGVALPPSNFPFIDAMGRVWLTVSTRMRPRASAYRSDVADGFIVLIDERGPRVVADGLGYTNEARLAPDGRHLYVNETFGRRLTRFRVGPDGALTGRETVCAFGPGVFPDGLAFDEEGGVWITSIVSNRILRVDRDGAQTVVLEDSDPVHLAKVEEAFQSHTMGRPHLDGVVSARLRNVSSLAFGGPDRRTAYLGCLLGDRIACFRSPVAGVPTEGFAPALPTFAL